MRDPISLLANWWRSAVDTDVVLKDYRCFKDVECSIQGFASTPSTDNITDIYESISSLNQLHLHYDVIKSALEDLRKSCSSRFNIPDEVEWHSISAESLSQVFRDANETEVNIGFLWAAFLKRSDLFARFLKLGAQLSFSEHRYGLSALHLVAYNGCKPSTDFLLSQKGCYVNLMCKCYSPLHCAAFGDSAEVAAILLERGANIDAFTNDFHCSLEGVLHCAIRANAVACLKLLCDKGAKINQPASSGRTPIHLASELGYTECLRVLVKAKGVIVDTQTKEKQQTALHMAAQKQHPESVDVLLDHGAIATITDYKQRTPLHLAAKSICNDSVKILLRKGKANPNSQDTDQRAPLHLAVSKISRINCSDTLKSLIRYGADINAKDSYGYTPLHLAAQHELSDCVETLILADADITAKCKAGITALGMISKKIPSSIDAIRKKLDECVTFSQNGSSSRELELQIDFTTILQHCHPKEIMFLKTLLDEGQKDLLMHPVCRAFLHLKWGKIRKFFIFRAVCCFLLVVNMTAYVLMGISRNCYNFSKNVTVRSYKQDKELCLNHSFSGNFIINHPNIIELEWYLMVVFAIGIVLRKLCGLRGCSSIVQYLRTTENLLDWSTVVTVFLISFVYTGRTYIWQNHVSAFGVLLAWTNFLYILGQFPFLGTYIAMYSAVQNAFAKLLLVFSCLLIGFTVSFCVLFPESEVFSNIYIGFITVLVMAIGEMNIELITPQNDTVFVLDGSMQIIYSAFVTCVTIILLNLLVGIAVHDIQGLKKTAKLTKLTKTTYLIYCIETGFFKGYLHRKIWSKVFQCRTLVSAKGYCVLNVKLNNHQERILPKDILQSAHDVARKHKKKNKNNFLKMLTNNNQNNPVNIKNQLKKTFEACCADRDHMDLRNDVRNLNNEVMNMKILLESNQRVMEQILRVVKNNEEE